MEVSRKCNVLSRRLRQQTHPQVKLPVGAEQEWTTTVIWVYGFRAQEPLELRTSIHV